MVTGWIGQRCGGYAFLLAQVVGCGLAASGERDSESAGPPEAELPEPEAPAVFLDACGCAQSAALHALRCGGNASYWLHSTPAGNAIVFSADDNTYRWTPAGGTEILMTRSSAFAMSDDASTLLLQVNSDLVIWRANGSSEVVGSMSPLDMNADGSVVLAWDYSAARSVLWTAERGVIGIADGDVRDPLTAMTRDGSAVVGLRNEIDAVTGFANASSLVRWTDSVGLRELSPLPPGAQGSTVDAVSSSGDVVAGSFQLDFGSNSYGVYRWTQTEGLRVVIPDKVLWFTLMSDDGSAVVSSRADATRPTRAVAVRWTEGVGVDELAASDDRSTYPSAMTPDGTTIVGFGLEPGSDLQTTDPVYAASPFMWRADIGYRDIEDVLASAGADLEGWQLGAPGAVSADGRVMLGNGTCAGSVTTYRLILPR